MNQIAILPAGCLVSSKDILFSNDQHIIYSSNLAVYILNAQSFIIEKIIAVTERTVASIAVSPHNHNLLIATGLDGCLSYWKLNEEELICRVSVQANTGFLLAWDPFSPDHCAVLMNQPNMRLLYWDMRKAGSGLSELFVIKNQTVQVSVIRWNLLTPGLLAAGCNNGWVILFQTTSKSQKTLSVPERSVAVTDVQWDRLSAVYLLVAYQTFISLWDTESLTEIHTFDKQGGNISAIAWMDWTAGNFVSSNSKNGYLRVWNASQRQPLESVRVAIGGLVTVYFGTGTKRAICACLDGSVVVFHMVKLQMEYCTSAGHTETIFDCSFSPASPDLLATASYDGTVKLWNVPDLRLTRTLLNSREKCIVYACDWSPKGNMVVACNSLGGIIIWDMQSGNELTRYAHHTKAVYCVAWNKFDESLIASTSGDCTLVVIAAAVESRKEGSAVSTSSISSSQPSRMKLGLAGQSTTGRRRSLSGQEGSVAASDIQLKFVHPAPVFGCAWSKHSSILLVTCCQDGNVRVFDCALHGKALVRQVLVGHTARAFVAAWSPLLPGIIASGSDDQTVLIWKIDMDMDLVSSDAKPGLPVPALKMLRGHTSNIRALLWSSEVKGLLLSGSWDSTIRLWDATTGKCLHVVTDHSADVYTIASHPNRPFTFMSCSRDTTVRLWELSDILDRMRMQAVFECSLGNLIEEESVSTQPAGPLLVTRSEGKQGAEDSVAAVEAVSGGLEASNGGGSLQVHSPSPAGSKTFSLLTGRASRMLNKELARLDATSTCLPSTPRSSSPVPKGQLEQPRAPKSYPTVSERIFLAQKYHKIFNFFSGANGSLDVLDGVLTLLAVALSKEKEKLGEEGDEEHVRSSFTALTTADVAAVMAVVRSPQHRLILHESEILPRARGEARVTESVRMASKRGDLTGKTEEQLRKAALLHARLGDFTRYCTIMVDLGEWTAALALAPSVSMEYWKELTTRYALHLSSMSSEQCVPYLLAVRSDAEAVDFYLQRRDVSSALALAKMSEGRKDCPQFERKSSAERAEEKESKREAKKVEEQGVEATFSLASIINTMNREEDDAARLGNFHAHSGLGTYTKRELVLAVNAQAASQYLTGSRPMHAAAQLLAVGDVDSAVRILSACGEHDLAYAVSLCMDLDCDVCLINLAGKMATHSALPQALDLLDCIRGPGVRVGVRKSSPLGTILNGSMSSVALDDFVLEEKGLLLSRSLPLHPSDLAAGGIGAGVGGVGVGVGGIGISLNRQPREPSFWISKGVEEEAIGFDGEAVVKYVLGRQYARAANIAVSSMKKQVRDPLDLSNSFRRMLRALKYMRVMELEDPLKGQLLSHVFWFSAHEAAEIGLWETGWCILRALRAGSAVKNLPVPLADIKYQELIFKVACGELSALLLLDEILTNTPQETLSVTPSDSAGSYSAAGLTVSVDIDQAKGDKESNLEIKELFTPAPSSPPHSAEQKGDDADLRFRATPTWSEQAAGALRNLGKMSSSPKGEEKEREREGEREKGKSNSKEAKCRAASSPSPSPRTNGFAPPPEEINEILRKLRALIIEAGSALIASRSRSLPLPLSSRYSSFPSSTRTAPRVSSPPNQASLDQRAPSAADRKASAAGVGAGVGALGDSERWGDTVWGPTTAEVHRQLHRLSSALSLPAVTQLLNPCSRRPLSSRAESDASNLAKLRPLVREAFISTKIVAKGSLLPVANMHFRLLESCITQVPIQGAIVELSYAKQEHGYTASESHQTPPLLAGANEALAWCKVLPFLPDMSGELVRLV